MHAAALTGLVVTVSGCAPVEVVESPLVNPREPPIVLVEGRKLALPSTGPGNRFVSGWLFDEGDSGWIAEPAGGTARLEVVRLRDRARRLSLATLDDASGAVVTAAVGSRHLEVVAAAAGIDIQLPADLLWGRSLIELEFAGGAKVRIESGSLSSAAKPGTVTLDGEDVIQSAWSAADFVRWVEPDTTLVGEFTPPSNPSHEQSFALILDDGGGRSETAFDVQPGHLRSGDPVSIRVPLRNTAGLVRIRLVAEGHGPAGTWRGLRLTSRERTAVTDTTRVPNPPRAVVVYVLDALRTDVVGFLGSDAGATPCIDRLAAEGAAFADHFSVAPNTGPSTMSLFTGYGFLRGRAIPDEGPRTLSEDFADAGFKTVSISSNPHLSPSYGLTRGFQEVLFEPIDEDFGADVETDPAVNDSADRVNAAALSWLDSLARDERAFLYLHTLNPHNPYSPPSPYPSRYLRSAGSSIDGGTRTLAAIRGLELETSPADELRIREWYTAGVAYNDAVLCRLADELRRRFGDDVLLAVTSDHGEELFDHGGVLHGYTLYDELLHVPLVMWWPHHIAPARIRKATDTLDLFDALRELVESGHVGQPSHDGSLWGAISGEKGGEGKPKLHFATAPGLRRAAMARSRQWKLILAPRPRLDWGMGRGRGRTHEAEYVFNLAHDPAEDLNNAGAAELEVDWLRSRLSGWVDGWEARQPAPRDARPDEATRERLEALGYLD